MVVLRLHGLDLASGRCAASDAVGGATWRSVLLARRTPLGSPIAANLANLASVARLAGALGVGKLAFDGAGEVAAGMALAGTGGNAMLDALDLVHKLRFILRGPLGGHLGNDGMFRSQTTAGLVA